tara:strand:- start:2318 stop:3955 length:1638 start_codon:yes stop_codon:yes gene_type:complete
LISISTLSLLYGLSGFPRSVIFIDYIFSTILLSLSRASVRLYHSNYAQSKIISFSKYKKKSRKKIMIIGAGNSSEKIIREIRDNKALDYLVVGLVDDDERKIGATIHGVPILCPIHKLPNILIPFDEIIICIPKATSDQMRRIVAVCKTLDLPYRTVPTFSELIDGKVSIKSVREVSIIDLLGRKEVQLNRNSISNYLEGKKILVTGAGGSIGSELVRQCSTFDPDLLILLDQSEHNLFNIEKEAAKSKYPVAFQTILGDIRDKVFLERVFSSFLPDVVFHAAAYKHVPMQEEHPWEAVKTNIDGTYNLINVSESFNVNRFVLVSTDKAVNPTNIMGATKRIAEKLIQSKSYDSEVKFMAVRFGNVIGSSGSVIPTFQKQIRSGGPVTITDSKMKRYFMSISESAQLILQAGSMGNGGEIFVLDMGDPVNIKDIAYELIRLSGLEPEKDISIEFIGSRPGEKLFEELSTKSESIISTSHDKILVMKNKEEYSWNYMTKAAISILNSAKSYNINQISKELKNYIPEYSPNKISFNRKIKKIINSDK